MGENEEAEEAEEAEEEKEKILSKESIKIAQS